MKIAITSGNILTLAWSWQTKIPEQAESHNTTLKVLSGLTEGIFIVCSNTFPLTSMLADSTASK